MVAFDMLSFYVAEGRPTVGHRAAEASSIANTATVSGWIKPGKIVISVKEEVLTSITDISQEDLKVILQAYYCFFSIPPRITIGDRTYIAQALARDLEKGKAG